MNTVPEQGEQQPTADPPPDAETLRLRADQLFAATLARLPWCTLLLLLLFAVLHFAVAMQAGGSDENLVLLLVVSGAKTDALILGGQWWRLLSSAFLHGTFTHLLVNSIGILMLGWFVENALGRSRLLLLFVLSAMTGALVSVLSTDQPSVGASGGMFGLLGATLGYAVLYWRKIPGILRTYVVGLPLAVGLATLLHGVMAANVDNSAHLGGGAAGLAAVFVMLTLDRFPVEPLRFLGRFLAAAAVLAVVYAVGATVAHLAGRFELPPVELAVRAEGEPSAHLWPVGWERGLLHEGACVLGQEALRGEIECYGDPFYSTLVVGPTQRMRGTGIYTEWLRRHQEEAGEGLYESYEIYWAEDPLRELSFALLAFRPIADKYLPLFAALRARPGPGRARPAAH